jgi:hypothetical protein
MQMRRQTRFVHEALFTVSDKFGDFLGRDLAIGMSDLLLLQLDLFSS